MRREGVETGEAGPATETGIVSPSAKRTQNGGGSGGGGGGSSGGGSEGRPVPPPTPTHTPASHSSLLARSPSLPAPGRFRSRSAHALRHAYERPPARRSRLPTNHQPSAAPRARQPLSARSEAPAREARLSFSAPVKPAVAQALTRTFAARARAASSSLLSPFPAPTAANRRHGRRRLLSPPTFRRVRVRLPQSPPRGRSIPVGRQGGRAEDGPRAGRAARHSGALGEWPAEPRHHLPAAT